MESFLKRKAGSTHYRNPESFGLVRTASNFLVIQLISIHRQCVKREDARERQDCERLLIHLDARTRGEYLSSACRSILLTHTQITSMGRFSLASLKIFRVKDIMHPWQSWRNGTRKVVFHRLSLTDRTFLVGRGRVAARDETRYRTFSIYIVDSYRTTQCTVKHVKQLPL